MAPPHVLRELPPELIELVLTFAWLEPRAWHGRVRDYIAYTTVCRIWRYMMLRVSLRFIHVNLIPPFALEALLRKRVGVEDSDRGQDGERLAVCYGDLCLFAAFRIGSLSLSRFQNTFKTVFPLTPRLQHVRLDFTEQHGFSWSHSSHTHSTRTPLDILDSVISALEAAPETLRIIDVICGCPSNPYGQSSEPSPSHLSLPNVEHLSIDSDEDVLVIDLVARCPNLRSLRLSCAYGVLGRLRSAAPKLEALALNVEPHPAVRLSGHLPFFVRKSALQNWRVLDALACGLLAGRPGAVLRLERASRFDERNKELDTLLNACLEAGIRLQLTLVLPEDAPSYHPQFLSSTPDRQKLKKMVSFFVP